MPDRSYIGIFYYNTHIVRYFHPQERLDMAPTPVSAFDVMPSLKERMSVQMCSSNAKNRELVLRCRGLLHPLSIQPEPYLPRLFHARNSLLRSRLWSRGWKWLLSSVGTPPFILVRCRRELVPAGTDGYPWARTGRSRRG
jgi:hypothetical protein